MEKKFIIKKVLDDSVLAKNEYQGYSMILISDFFLTKREVKFFESKEDAEKYIIENNLSQTMVVEIFL